MARAAGFNNAFNSGELSPDAWSRSDLQQHAHGMSLGLNLLGTVTGPARRAPGTWFIGLTKGQGESDRTILIPFARNPDDTQMIEMGAGYFRVWYADGSPVMDGGSPLEVAHGWTVDDLDRLSWYQNGDLIVITHRDGQRQRRIRRVAPDDWEIADYGFKNGPWRPENDDRAFTITIAGTDTVCTEDPEVGNIAEDEVVTLTASADLFDDPLHVGALFRLRQNDGNHGSESWAPRTNYKIGQFVLSSGRIYKRLSGGPKPSADTCGLTPLIHLSGEVSDGRWTWLFMNDGAGVVEITAVTSATVATGIVRRPVPLQDGQATSYWSEGAWSPLRGYPGATPTVRGERMFFGGAPGEPDKFDLTRAGGFNLETTDFTPGLGTGLVVDTDAVRRYAGETPGKVVWAINLPYLIVGTSSQELLVSGESLEGAISPAGTNVRGLSDYGSAEVAPVKAHDAVLFVVRGGQTLRALRMSPDQGQGGQDLSVVADHLGARGFAQLAWQGSENLCWVRLADGGLAAMVYHVEQQVYGFTRRVLAAGADQEEAGDWSVESIAVLPGRPDSVWLTARRAKGAGFQRAVLKMARRVDGNFYDLAERYSGAPTGTISGLDHLEGETVNVMADGAEDKGLVVTGGAVTLPHGRTASEIIAGLPYMTRFRSLPLDLGGPGSTQGMRTRMEQGLVIIDGVEARAGTDTQARLEKVEIRQRSEVARPVPRRHVQKITFGGDTSRDVRVVVETHGGFDLAIHAIRPVGGANS